MIAENYICDCDYPAPLKDRNCPICGRHNYKFKLPPTEEEMLNKKNRVRIKRKEYYYRNIDKFRKYGIEYYHKYYSPFRSV